MTAAPPLPQPTVESAPFWEAVAKGELRIQRCARDGDFFFPPASRCPRDWSTDWTWERVSGRGAVRSFVVFQRSYHPAFRDLVPYAVAVVELEEGPRMATRLIDVDVKDVRVGMPVELTIGSVGDARLPLFRPS
jgi:uncharacterized OB-fold protein